MLLVCGALFVAFGIGAFFGVPGGHDAQHHTAGHNLTHILIGLACISVAWIGESTARRRFCFGVGGLYLLAGIAGVYSTQDNLRIIPGLLEFHLEDSWIHIATGLLFIGLGLLRNRIGKPRQAFAT